MSWLARTRLTSICLLALLFALVSNSGETVSAQSSSAAPAEAQKLSSVAELPPAPAAKAPNPPDAAKAPNPADVAKDPARAKELSKAFQIVKKRGSSTYLADYVSYGLGLPNATQQPMWASMLDIDDSRRVYAVNDTDVAVVMTAVGEQTIVYLVRGGVLKKAAKIQSGRMGSKSLKDIPLASAAAGFNAERDKWIELLAAKFPPGSRSKSK